MNSNKLEFPEPYKHDHPPVRNAAELFEKQLTFSQKAADWVAEAVGSWKFIFLQTAIFGFWISINVTSWFNHWDPYPFILMNLEKAEEEAHVILDHLKAQNKAF